VTTPRDPAPSILVITPTYDERDNLAALAARLHAALPAAHLLVVDDASPDGTGALAAELASADPRVQVIHRPAKLGLGTAYVAGFRHALAHGYEVVVEMDADLSHDPCHLPAFLEALGAGADVVVGSRNIAGGGVVGWGPGRRLLSAGGSLYARLVLGVPIRDLTTGFKAFTRAALTAIDVGSLGCNGYAFQIETSYRAWRSGLRVVEIPIVFSDRRVGRSKLSGEVFAEAVVAPWRMRLRPFSGPPLHGGAGGSRPGDACAGPG
jgi:dolichol-phosphate mannosyltransferase